MLGIRLMYHTRRTSPSYSGNFFYFLYKYEQEVQLSLNQLIIGERLGERLFRALVFTDMVVKVIPRLRIV